ncbi:Sec-independent protein translocase subunit TatB [Streptomyces sp. AJS327]|uniref:sec-independent translocase n=1 Tax=Streptomyces sp. AJS327 TaxID=2545265 RepID=UPI0015DD8B93|nr:sec-independent translocase [Streptomyces sp. AJS327]MBA0051428.1 Sec-independent protein translocase subunit TatB [Streptomyces sp. AJS327]
MFFDIGPLELLVLIILAVLIFGPEKLPKVIQDTANLIRKVREFSDSAKNDIRSELGPEFKDFEFEDLNPKTFAKKHLLDNDELGLKEIQSSFDLRKDLAEVTDAVNGTESADEPASGSGANGSGQRHSLSKEPGTGAKADLSKERPSANGAEPASGEPVTLSKNTPPPFDADAT